MTTTLSINGIEHTLTLTKRRGQKRIVIRKTGATHFTVSAPRRTTLTQVKSTIKANSTSLTTLMPAMDFKRYLANATELSIFGEHYTVVFTKGDIRRERQGNTLYMQMKSLSQSNKMAHLEAFLKSLLLARVETIHKEFQRTHPDIAGSDVGFVAQYMKSRFGSCIPAKRRINFNLALVHYPPMFLRHIYCHEITHMVHKDHSLRFYAALQTLDPDYHANAQALRSYHATFARDNAPRL